MILIAILLLVAAGVSLTALGLFNISEAKRIKKEIENRLTAKAESLEREKNRLEDWETELTFMQERLFRNPFSPVKAAYYVSESDTIKYNTDAKLQRAVYKNLAMQVAEDILKTFEPRHTISKEKEMYILELWVKEQTPDDNRL